MSFQDEIELAVSECQDTFGVSVRLTGRPTGATYNAATGKYTGGTSASWTGKAIKSERTVDDAPGSLKKVTETTYRVQMDANLMAIEVATVTEGLDDLTVCERGMEAQDQVLVLRCRTQLGLPTGL